MLFYINFIEKQRFYFNYIFLYKKWIGQLTMIHSSPILFGISSVASTYKLFYENFGLVLRSLVQLNFTFSLHTNCSMLTNDKEVYKFFGGGHAE